MTVATFASSSPDVSFRESRTPLIPSSFTPSPVLYPFYISIPHWFFGLAIPKLCSYNEWGNTTSSRTTVEKFIAVPTSTSAHTVSTSGGNPQKPFLPNGSHPKATLDVATASSRLAIYTTNRGDGITSRLD